MVMHAERRWCSEPMPTMRRRGGLDPSWTARTPLIISGPSEQRGALKSRRMGIVTQQLTEEQGHEGREGAQHRHHRGGIQRCGHPQDTGLSSRTPRSPSWRTTQEGPPPVPARRRLRREGREVVIIDEFTGTPHGGGAASRTAPSRPSRRRSASGGQSEPLATITLKNYFRMYLQAGRDDGAPRPRRPRSSRDLRAQGRDHPDAPEDDPPGLSRDLRDDAPRKFRAVAD